MSSSVNARFEMCNEGIKEARVSHTVSETDRTNFLGQPGGYAAKNALDFEAMLRERENECLRKRLKSKNSRGE